MTLPQTSKAATQRAHDLRRLYDAILSARGRAEIADETAIAVTLRDLRRIVAKRAAEIGA